VDAFFLIGSVERIAERVEEIRAGGSLDRLLLTLMSPAGWEESAWSDLAGTLAKRVLK
jgi:hypothetical protein